MDPEDLRQLEKRRRRQRAEALAMTPEERMARFVAMQAEMEAFLRATGGWERFIRREHRERARRNREMP